MASLPFSPRQTMGLSPVAGGVAGGVDGGAAGGSVAGRGAGAPAGGCVSVFIIPSPVPVFSWPLPPQAVAANAQRARTDRTDSETTDVVFMDIDLVGVGTVTPPTCL